MDTDMIKGNKRIFQMKVVNFDSSSHLHFRVVPDYAPPEVNCINREHFSNDDVTEMSLNNLETRNCSLFRNRKSTIPVAQQLWLKYNDTL